MTIMLITLTEISVKLDYTVTTDVGTFIRGLLKKIFSWKVISIYTDN